MIDLIKHVNDLRDSGFDTKNAEAIVKMVDTAMDNKFVVKADLENLSKEVSNQSGRIDALSGRVDSIGEQVGTLSGRMDIITLEMKTQFEKIDLRFNYLEITMNQQFELRELNTNKQFELRDLNMNQQFKQQDNRMSSLITTLYWFGGISITVLTAILSGISYKLFFA